MKNFKEIVEKYLNKNKKYNILTIGVEDNNDLVYLKDHFNDPDISSIVSSITEINSIPTKVIQMEANNFRGLRMLFYHSRFDCIIDNRADCSENEKAKICKYLFEILSENGIYIINHFAPRLLDENQLGEIGDIEIYNDSVLVKQKQ